MKKAAITLAILLSLSGCTTEDEPNQSGMELQQNATNEQGDDSNEKTGVNEGEYDLKIVDGDVFYNGCKQEGIDPSTVVEVNEGYIKDKDNVYWNNRIGCDASKLDNADPDTFIGLNQFFGKDKNHSYAGERKIEGADSTTFEIANIEGVLEWACAKDKNRVYKHRYLNEDNEGKIIDDECNVVE